ncbi:MAG: ArsR/SmtB family transcription factor [Casimicrobiaceae bacterium]
MTRALYARTLNCMVQYAPHRLDVVFGALADPTRRAVLTALRRGERSVGELAEPFPMSLTGFIKHLGILADAGLIERRKTGRVVSCHLKDGAMKSALDWLERQEEFWNARLDRLSAFLEQPENQTWKPSPTKKPASRSGASSRPRSPPSTPRSPTPKK